MALRKQDVRAGAVAYLDHRPLLADASVRRLSDSLDRKGPFVCIQVEDDRSVWAPLTGTHRPERLAIRREWRLDGSLLWRTADLFLNDGRNTFVGPVAAFIRAGVSEMPFSLVRRPRVTDAGLAEIVEEVEARQGLLLQASSAH